MTIDRYASVQMDADGNFIDPLTPSESNIIAPEDRVGITVETGKRRMSLGGDSLTQAEAAQIELNLLVDRAQRAEAHAAAMLNAKGELANAADATTYANRVAQAQELRAAAAGFRDLENARLAEESASPEAAVKRSHDLERLADIEADTKARNKRLGVTTVPQIRVRDGRTTITS